MNTILRRKSVLIDVPQSLFHLLEFHLRRRRARRGLRERRPQLARVRFVRAHRQLELSLALLRRLRARDVRALLVRLALFRVRGEAVPRAVREPREPPELRDEAAVKARRTRDAIRLRGIDGLVLRDLVVVDDAVADAAVRVQQRHRAQRRAREEFLDRVGAARRPTRRLSLRRRVDEHVQRRARTLRRRVSRVRLRGVPGDGDDRRDGRGLGGGASGGRRERFRGDGLSGMDGGGGTATATRVRFERTTRQKRSA